MDHALLQHNQAVAAAGNTVYIADTYNNKIKAVELDVGTVRTWLGSGQSGTLDGPGANARFAEPGDISLQGDSLYIADTNNHLIRVASIESSHVATLELHGLHNLEQ